MTVPEPVAIAVELTESARIIAALDLAAAQAEQAAQASKQANRPTDRTERKERTS